MSQLRGIFGGTFDPIHTGHLRTAIELCECAGLDQMHLLPLNQAVHREQPEADAEQRLAMVAAAASIHPRLCADDSEIRRGGASYMADTLADFRQRYPGDRLCLVLGHDAFASFDNWGRAEQIPQLAHILVAARPGYALEVPQLLADCEVRDDPQQAFAGAQSGRLCCVQMSQLEISSSDIRRRLQAQQSISLLVPEAVERLIAERGFYRGLQQD